MSQQVRIVLCKVALFTIIASGTLFSGTETATLNDPERRNGPIICVIEPNALGFQANYVKLVEARPIIMMN